MGVIKTESGANPKGCPAFQLNKREGGENYHQNQVWEQRVSGTSSQICVRSGPLKG
ncbi:MAG: hypothetical protein THHGLFOP_000625 [Candidatus Fervidibacter sp.]|jgi:hypothetical protein